jgi:hypothetical protein
MSVVLQDYYSLWVFLVGDFIELGLTILRFGIRRD